MRKVFICTVTLLTTTKTWLKYNTFKYIWQEFCITVFQLPHQLMNIEAGNRTSNAKLINIYTYIHASITYIHTNMHSYIHTPRTATSIDRKQLVFVTNTLCLVSTNFLCPSRPAKQCRSVDTPVVPYCGYSHLWPMPRRMHPLSQPAHKRTHTHTHAHWRETSWSKQIYCYTLLLLKHHTHIHIHVRRNAAGHSYATWAAAKPQRINLSLDNNVCRQISCVVCIITLLHHITVSIVCYDKR